MKTLLRHNAKASAPSISPVWVSDTGLHSIAATITFAELKEILIAAMADAKEFASMLK
jgi:hypothetical protein